MKALILEKAMLTVECGSIVEISESQFKALGKKAVAYKDEAKEVEPKEEAKEVKPEEKEEKPKKAATSKKTSRKKKSED